MATSTNAALSLSGVSIQSLEARAFLVPTEEAEADGTLQWDKTTLVLVVVRAADIYGLGYSYADRSTASFIREHLAPLVVGADAVDTVLLWSRMYHAVRNLGQCGVASMAISAVDNALWDLKAKALGLPLYALLGGARDRVPGYGSGGFTSYRVRRLQEQLARWVELGFRWVKMKVGVEPEKDLLRVEAARSAIGEKAGLFVDANGAYVSKEAASFSAADARDGLLICDPNRPGWGLELKEQEAARHARG